MTILNRRDLMIGAGALGAAAILPRTGHAAGTLTAAIYPGTWEEAYRGVVAPALKKAADIDVAFDSLFAVDQVAKVRAARGVPPFDCFVLDPGPAAAAQAAGLFEPIDASKLSNAPKVPTGLITSHGVTCNAQVVGIAYNPKKFAAAPKGWADLFKSPYVERLGLTGFQTTFGTVSIIEMAKVFGGSETNVEPVFAELKKAVAKAAAVAAPAAMPGLFQQGQIDIMYTNTNTVAILKGRGVDIEFVKPETGAITFQTTLHIVKGADNVANAYKYMDTAISAEVQTLLQRQPYNMIPINKDVTLVDTLDIKSLDELAKMATHDWSKINPLRAAWIERFNKEITK
ncbi:extracellular solute-binding protein [Phreatobacter aquaticus]|uniref:Extracellular solute-binding protein n=1 Tax=Phreatobacter aquaticus TaxID=2570229 RepID=A0A4D7QJ42_9HYPH|nr:extracellular solute-binding protein [Phreatobacter aquaticus]QCK87518.1 extracellular solute-binding protein [Phreatobacter aquaticus]